MRINTNNFKTPVLILCFFYFLTSCRKEIIVNDFGRSFDYEAQEITPGVVIGDVYTTKNFAAFTDITYYHNAWYIIFRAGTQHLGGQNGQIKILKSLDANTWKVDQIIQNDSLDLRGPKFMVDTLNDELFINFFGVINNPKDVDYRIHNFIISYIQINDHETPQEINANTSAEKFAFWRYTYHKGKIYSASFRVPILGGYATDDICLFNNNNDYRTYSAIGSLKLGSSPNEATVRFDANDNMYFLIRREVANVALGFSTPADYTKVTWLQDPLSIKLSSPNFLFYNNEKLLISGRDQGDQKFKFFCYNLTTNKIEKKFTFPSGNETGYAGMSYNPANKDELLMSYYIISGNKSSIRLIRMNLKTFLN